MTIDNMFPSESADGALYLSAAEANLVTEAIEYAFEQVHDSCGDITPFEYELKPTNDEECAYANVAYDFGKKLKTNNGDDHYLISDTTYSLVKQIVQAYYDTNKEVLDEEDLKSVIQALAGLNSIDK